MNIISILSNAFTIAGVVSFCICILLLPARKILDNKLNIDIERRIILKLFLFYMLIGGLLKLVEIIIF